MFVLGLYSGLFTVRDFEWIVYCEGLGVDFFTVRDFGLFSVGDFESIVYCQGL